MRKIIRNSELGRNILLATFFTVLTAGAAAQTPSISVSGLPAEPLIGEAFCTTVSLTNTAIPTGYGPYLISTVDDGISDISIDFIDIEPVLEFIGTFDASGQLIDPISGQIITGNVGANALNVIYPVGAVEQTIPALEMEFCGVVDIGTEPNLPLAVTFTPGFEFGDTATGTNGAILGPTFSSTITPRLARVVKTNSAPENERPPGPSHTFNYRYALDVSAGVKLTDVLLEDILPTELQWSGGNITISSPLGAGCRATGLPNFAPAPGGTLTVQCIFVAGTSGSDDLVVTIPVWVTDILDETIDDRSQIVNTVKVDYGYRGDNFSDTDTSELLAMHAAAQKSVSGGDQPGEALNYSIDFQLTDYPSGIANKGARRFIITDLLPDGLQFTTTVDLTINGTAIAITPSTDFNPVTGVTEIVWDIAAAIDSSAPLLPNATAGRLRYQALILNNYVNPPGPVQASDKLNNSVNLGYSLTEGGSGSDQSGETTEIIKNSPDKVVSDPPPGSFDTVMPGSPVTFTLTLDIPAGSSSDVVIQDFLPSPVFDVSVTPLPSITVIKGPSITPTFNAGSNSVSLNYGDIISTIPVAIEVELVATVTTEPFADELFLTNLMQTSYTTTNGEVITEQDVAGITVGAPELVITKGVIGTDNVNALINPDPSATPANSNAANADAKDTVIYQITLENVGTQPAFLVNILDPEVPGLSCLQGSISASDGSGNTLGFKGNLETGMVLDNPLAANDNLPAGGGPPYSADTAIITIDCKLADTVSPLSTIINTASATWTSTNDPSDTRFPAITDDAQVTIAAPKISKAVVGSQPGYSGDKFKLQIGEIVSYRVEVTVPEGVSPSVRFEDLLDPGMTHIEAVNITLPAGVTSSLGDALVLAGNQGVLASGSGLEADDRLRIFGPNSKDDGFGNITNSNDSNSTPEVIVIEYRARVINSSLNVSNASLRNRARWYWKPEGGSRLNVQAKATRIIVLEPDLRVTKNFMPDIGDNTTNPTVTITFEHSGASTGDAFDLALTEPLPADMGILGDVAGVTVSGGCAPPDSIQIVTGIADTLFINWKRFDSGSGICKVQFQTEFLIPSVIAGARFNNCVGLFWESLLDSDQPLASPPSNTIAVERTGNTDDPGSDANTYNAVACDVFRIYDVGIAKTIHDTSQSHTDSNPDVPLGTEALTIGEIVSFNLDVTLPLAPTVDLRITDLLPRTEMILELLDIEHIALGSDLTPRIFPPNKRLSDSNGDGINDSGELEYGAVGHNLVPPVIDDNDRIKVRVTAKVLDRSTNSSEKLDSNSAVVRFLPDTSASDNYPLTLVEPVLVLNKFGSTGQVDAGDTIDYRVIVSHATGSKTDAQNITFIDTLPPELTLVLGSLKVGDACSTAPNQGLDIIGQTITARWTSFPLGASCEIDFSTTVSQSAITGQTIQNKAELTWASLNEGEQPNDEDDRTYTVDDTWEVAVSLPGLEKNLTATSVTETPFREGGSTNSLTIGEQATFTLVASFPDGTTPNARLEDVLPDNDVALEFVSSRIVAIGADLTISGAPTVGEPATACAPPAKNCLNWLLGTVVNTPDIRDEPDGVDQIVVEVVAIVLDNPLNSGAPGEDKNLINVGRLYSSEATLTSTEQFDLVEPQLRIQKRTSNGSIEKSTAAGMEETFTLTINHRALSTAAAKGLVITDVLHPEMEWIDDKTVDSTCPNLVIEKSPTSGTSGDLVMSMSRLTLTQNNCQISYRIKMSGALPVQGVFENSVSLAWESAPTSTESRRSIDSSKAILISFDQAAIGKRVLTTSLPETESKQGDPSIPDVAIAEHIEYAISLRFAEGKTSNVRLVDTFQFDAAGELEFLGGDIFYLGDNMIIGNPAVPEISGNTITIDLGDVVNTADLNTSLNDTIIFRLQLRAPDSTINAAGDILWNEVALSYSGAGGIPMSEFSEAKIELVEPILTQTKTFTALENAVATIELAIGNTGTAPAFDLSVVDRFDETIWVPGSLVPVSIPPGYVAKETSNAGMTTVTIAVENPSSAPPPSQVLLPGESATVTFSMTLQNNGQPGPTVIPNIATLEASSLAGADDAKRTYSAGATDTLRLPALALQKVWSGPNNPAVPGDLVRYTLTAQNTGNADATEIIISDTPDAIGEFKVGSVVTSSGVISKGNTSGDAAVEITLAQLAPGGQLTVSYDVRIPLPYPSGISTPEALVNQATMTSKELTSVLSDDPSTTAVNDKTIVPIVADPVMTITKNDGVLRVMPGESLTYVVNYANTGNQDATGVLLTEVVPDNTTFNAGNSDPNWSCSNISAGSVCQLNLITLAGNSGGSAAFEVTINPAVPSDVFQIVNEVTITEDGLEFGGVTSSPSMDKDQDIDYLRARPNLVIAKGDGGISVIPGQGYRYTIIYGNTGDQDATGTLLTETVPENTLFENSLSTPGWTCDSNLPGSTCALNVGTIEARSGSFAQFGLSTDYPAAAGVDLIANSVLLQDDGRNEIGRISVEANDITPLIATPDIIVEKSTSAQYVKEGDTIVYNIIYRQAGNQDATGVIVREIVPIGTEYLAAESSVWSCADGAPALSICEHVVGNLSAGSSGLAAFAVEVKDLTKSENIINVVEANDDGTNGRDPTPASNVDTVIIKFISALPVSIPTMPRFFLFLLLALMIAVALRTTKSKRMSE